MKTSIKQFLSDLYEIDPTLQTHETELIPMLEKLLAKDPAPAPDAVFVARLRRELKDKAAAGTSAPAGSVWQKLWYALGGALTMAVIIPLAIVATNKEPFAPGSPLFSNSVQATGKNAFGPLSAISADGTTAEMSMARDARPQSGGGGTGMPPMVTNAVAPYGDADAKMIAPWPMVQYNYVFSGTLPELTANVPVYKKNSKPLNVPLSALAGSLNIGGLDMTSFNGMNIDNVSFVQRTAFGYMMSVNLREASVSIDANWEQWPQSTCQTDACWQAERVKIGDIPSDSALIATAMSFAKDHGIDLSEYGTPEVDNTWRRDYDRATDTSLAYVPDMQRVIFPQLIDGKPVYDQSGIKTGLSISVNVKHNKVMNVYGIADRSYLKSDYAGVTEQSEVQKYLSTVDNYFYGDVPADTKKVTITLGAPTVAYTVYYTYADNKNQELLVPSLIFPVESAEGTTPETMYYRSQVVVPLAKEMLEEQSNRPMPMMKGGVMMDGAAEAAVR